MHSVEAITIPIGKMIFLFLFTAISLFDQLISFFKYGNITPYGKILKNHLKANEKHIENYRKERAKIAKDYQKNLDNIFNDYKKLNKGIEKQYIHFDPFQNGYIITESRENYNPSKTYFTKYQKANEKILKDCQKQVDGIVNYLKKQNEEIYKQYIDSLQDGDFYQDETKYPFEKISEVYTKSSQKINEIYQKAEEIIKKNHDERIDVLKNGFKKQNEPNNEINIDPLPTEDIIQNRKVKNFKGIRISGTIHAYITQGNEESLKIEANLDIIDKIQTFVSGKILYILLNEHFNSYKNPIAQITLKNLHSIQTLGATNVECKSTLYTDELMIKSSEDSNVSLDLLSKSVIVSLSGNSTVKLTGKTQSMNFQLTENSSLKAADLDGQNADVKLSGTSKAVINAKKELRYDLSDYSMLVFKSNPNIYKALCSQTSSVSNYDGYDL